MNRIRLSIEGEVRITVHKRSPYSVATTKTTIAPTYGRHSLIESLETSHALIVRDVNLVERIPVLWPLETAMLLEPVLKMCGQTPTFLRTGTCPAS